MNFCHFYIFCISVLRTKLKNKSQNVNNLHLVSAFSSLTQTWIARPFKPFHINRKLMFDHGWPYTLDPVWSKILWADFVQQFAHVHTRGCKLLHPSKKYYFLALNTTFTHAYVCERALNSRLRTKCHKIMFYAGDKNDFHTSVIVVSRSTIAS